MRFLLDHDVPGEVARLLRHWGQDVLCLRHALPVTAADDEVFRHAQAEERVIISVNTEIIRPLQGRDGFPFPSVGCTYGYSHSSPLGMGNATERHRIYGS